MLFVVTMDQRGGRSAEDLVSPWAAELNHHFSSALRREFVRTSGDEMQAVVDEPEAVVDIVLRVVRRGGWWIGIGLGPIEEPLGQTARDSRGPAFWNARQAVTRAKARNWACTVVAEDAGVAENIEASFAMLIFIVSNRTGRAWEMVDLAAEGLNQSDIASRLGVSRQAVSKVLQTAGREEEVLGRRLAEKLLREAA